MMMILYFTSTAVVDGSKSRFLSDILVLQVKLKGDLMTLSCLINNFLNRLQPGTDERARLNVPDEKLSDLQVYRGHQE